LQYRYPSCEAWLFQTFSSGWRAMVELRRETHKRFAICFVESFTIARWSCLRILSFRQLFTERAALQGSHLCKRSVQSWHVQILKPCVFPPFEPFGSATAGVRLFFAVMYPTLRGTFGVFPDSSSIDKQETHKRFAICLVESLTNCEVTIPAPPVIQTTFCSSSTSCHLRFALMQVECSEGHGSFRSCHQVSPGLIKPPSVQSATAGVRLFFTGVYTPARLAAYFQVYNLLSFWRETSQTVRDMPSGVVYDLPGYHTCASCH